MLASLVTFDGALFTLSTTASGHLDVAEVQRARSMMRRAPWLPPDGSAREVDDDAFVDAAAWDSARDADAMMRASRLPPGVRRATPMR